MTRKPAFVLVLAAAIGILAGCKDDKPTPVKFDPSKANYGGQQGYRGGDGQTTQQGNGSGSTSR